MHVTTKEVDENGVHIITSVIEGDGPVALATESAQLVANVISVQRTASGGVQVQVALRINEPKPAVPVAVVAKSPEQEASDFFVAKGLSQADADAKVKQFGAVRVLAQRDAEVAEKEKQIDKELANFLAGGESKETVQ